jgi:hypothetical protein
LRRATLADTAQVQALCEDIDPTNALADPRHVFLLDGDNLLMFMWRWHGIYEVHIQFTTKGKEAERICRAMLDAMPWAMLLAVIPMSKRHVRLFARRMGFEPRGQVETTDEYCEMLEARK